MFITLSLHLQIVVLVTCNDNMIQQCDIEQLSSILKNLCLLLVILTWSRFFQPLMVYTQIKGVNITYRLAQVFIFFIIDGALAVVIAYPLTQKFPKILKKKYSSSNRQVLKKKQVFSSASRNDLS